MNKNNIYFLLVFGSLVIQCHCADIAVTVRCDADPSDATIIVSTFRVLHLSTADPINSVYAFTASGSVLEPTDRIAACTADTTGLTDLLTQPVEIVATVDPNAATPDCGAAVSTDGGTVTFVDFMFHVYATSDAFVTATDETYTYRCRSDQLNQDFVSVGPTEFNARPIIVAPNPYTQATLAIRDATSHVPLTSTVIGDKVILSVEFFPAVEKGPDNCGTLFYVGFLSNDAITADSAAALSIQVIPKYPVRTDVRVTAGNDVQTGVAISGEALNFDIDVALMGCAGDGEILKDFKGIEINSFNQEVCVVVFNREADTEEHFTALPVSATGIAYDMITPTDGAATSQLMIVASEDSTTASIHLPTGAPDITYDGSTYSAEQTISVLLNQRETLHLSQTASLSGFKVTSNNPVSVIFGNENFMGNHLGEQMPPIDRLGEKYVLPFIKPAVAATQSDWETEYLLQATVSGDTIVKQYTGPGSGDFTSLTLTYGNPPESVLINDDTECEIEADNPILVILVFKPPYDPTNPSDANYPTVGEPVFNTAMLVVPAVSQLAPLYRIANPGLADMNFIVVKKSPVNMVGRTNTAVVTHLLQTNTMHGPSGYNVQSNILVPSDLWTFYSDDDMSPFMVFPLAFSMDRAARMTALSLPINLRYPIYNECSSSGGRAGDLQDNDCDGLIDEELINKIDDDGDGLIDEDAQAYTKEYAGVVAIRPINCKVSAQSDFPDTVLTTTLTDADGCPVVSDSPFSLEEGWDPKTPDTDEKIGGADQLKVLYSGPLTIAMYFGHRQLYFMCETLNCYSTSDTTCTTDVCEIVVRRKRQSNTGDESNVTAEVRVNAFGQSGAEVTNPTFITRANPSVQECLQTSAIQAAGGLLIGVALLSIGTTCCFCFLLRNRWRSQKKRNKPPSSISSRPYTSRTSHSRRY